MDLIIFQASWCMRPSREQPFIDRTSSPISIRPDSSAAPPVVEENSNSALLRDTISDVVFYQLAFLNIGVELVTFKDAFDDKRPVSVA